MDHYLCARLGAGSSARCIRRAECRAEDFLKPCKRGNGQERTLVFVPQQWETALASFSNVCLLAASGYRISYVAVVFRCCLCDEDIHLFFNPESGAPVTHCGTIERRMVGGHAALVPDHSHTALY